ncbi:MurR/RpiR family transcriptional regulator [Paracidovorax konjaci]|uniref:DNA-binding transcriptional regulator, MurR/RpiR family, contains HTH and SIS domains n=1 Tax=Paracidovorax konjaci TaxID=32040 RepID=A0A1I1YUL1_9BURK|nr:MurR/RpiR family transcriptional regulator [Paracidovorax konjaci]SFE23246.1 DNA-binding transcriptional regulator, MurR/RpiR family, contains HTH and SIS domains [Paracidovorax konjaci]
MSDLPDAAGDAVSIAIRIGRARPLLTRSHQQMADYVLAHPLQAATMPIDELASAVGVSIATANRFARAIGLEGYPMLRAELVKGFEAMLAPIEKMRIKLEKPTSIRDVFAAALEESQRNIAATRDALDPSACEAAVQAILGARRVYLAGFGASGWLAGLLQRGLDAHCDNVHLLAGVGGASYGARMLTRMGADDLLIAISYPRYLTDTVVLAQGAFERGVRVLALTDGAQSPLVPFAHGCLFAQTENQYAANSESSALALIEALTSAVAHQARDSVKTAARMTEAVLPWLHDSSRSRLAPRAADTPGRKAEARAGRPARSRGAGR